MNPALLIGILLFPAACLLAWGVYEMWTMPPDDPRWKIYAEAAEDDPLDDDPFP